MDVVKAHFLLKTFHSTKNEEIKKQFGLLGIKPKRLKRENYDLLKLWIKLHEPSDVEEKMKFEHILNKSKLIILKKMQHVGISKRIASEVLEKFEQHLTYKNLAMGVPEWLIDTILSYCATNNLIEEKKSIADSRVVGRVGRPRKTHIDENKKRQPPDPLGNESLIRPVRENGPKREDLTIEDRSTNGRLYSKDKKQKEVVLESESEFETDSELSYDENEVSDVEFEKIYDKVYDEYVDRYRKK
jgi:hypothetical protein